MIPQSEVGRRNTSSDDKGMYWKVYPGDAAYNSMRMWQGVSGIAATAGIVSPAYTVCEPASLLDSQFLGRVLRHPANVSSFRRLSQGLTSDVWNLKFSRLRGLPILLPPLPEQRQIAAILDTVDDAIRRTEQIIAKLKQVKQGLLHDLLTRGIDENGELRDPVRHPEQFKDSALGRIPRGWEPVGLCELGEIETGRTPPSSLPGLWGTSLPFVTPAEVGDDGEVRTAERWVSERGCQHVRELPEGAVLVVCIGSTIGKIGVAPWRCATNQQINALMIAANHNAIFIPSVIRLHVEQLHRWAGLQAVPIVNKTQFGRMLVPIAPSPEQDEIARRVDAVDKRLRREHEMAAKLRLLKQALMDDLLTGRVRTTGLLTEATTSP